MMRPIIGITMGDPAGNGPELCIKALSKKALYDSCKPLVVGDARMLELAKTIVKHPELRIHAIENVQDAHFEYGTIDVYHMDLVDLARFSFGQLSPMCGEAAFRSVEKVIQLAKARQIDATVTNALNKEAINLAGHHFSGHTEIYADMTGTKKYTMMLAYKNLRVVHVSTHVALRQACDLVKKDRVLDVISIASKACRELGIAEPKIGVAGLNPHAGENGMFGREEIEEIIPAIEAAREQGMAVDGPVPPDTVFSKALGGWYDIVVCMYHDQGHIPLKVLGFAYNKEEGHWDAVEGVNITLGLPIVRTSVDHGTAFDLAGKGVASELSLENAIDYAIRLAENKGDLK